MQALAGSLTVGSIFVNPYEPSLVDVCRSYFSYVLDSSSAAGKRLADDNWARHQ